MKINEVVVMLEYYPRITLNEYTINQYKEQYEIGESLPPLVVQKEKHILIDGFHRFEAQKRLGWEEMEVELRDIPEDEIYLLSIELNRRHGLPFSREDRDKQIRKLRFERTPPLTYEEISKAVGLSTSRVGEICREMEFKNNWTINAKVDARRNITPEETEEIQDRLEAGEPTSKVAKDYPVGESRVSQLKKRPKTKKFRLTKSRPSRQGKPLPKKLTIYNLKRRFEKLNPFADPQEIDWDIVDTELIYEEALIDFYREYPDYKWYSPEEGRYYHLENIPPEIHEKSVTINLKLYWTNEAKYAQVKGTIPKRVLSYVRDKLHESFEIEWPLTENVLLNLEEQSDRRVFPELSDEELSELYEKSQEQYRGPEDHEPEDGDEEMNKRKDLIQER